MLLYGYENNEYVFKVFLLSLQVWRDKKKREFTFDSKFLNEGTFLNFNIISDVVLRFKFKGFFFVNFEFSLDIAHLYKISVSAPQPKVTVCIALFTHVTCRAENKH